MPIANNTLNKQPSSSKSGLYRIVSIRDQEKKQLKQLCEALHYLSEAQIDEVNKAYRVGAKAHEGQVRLAGYKYIRHPLAVAQLLAELHLDSKTIVAAILHDTIEDTHLTKADMERQFGAEVANLVAGVSKVDKVKFASPEQAQAENFRMLFLAMAGDIRVILIKLADRLHNLETLEVHRLEKRRRIVRETEDIYAPVANMLGMVNWQRQMEDLCFKAIYPKRYETIQKAIQTDIKGGVDQTIKIHVKAVQAMLDEKKIPAEVSGRFKTPSAIHRKMKRKSIRRLNAVQDLFAFRIVVETTDDCYRTLGLIHSRYKPVLGKFDDYIAIPKMNGYQSLHTTVNSEFGRAIEVQIRTKEMHRIAESGIASHLRYKLGGPAKYDEIMPKVDWLNELIHSLEDQEASSEYLENLKLSLFPDYVHVFTPQGDVKRLKKGATVIDFAYAVHSAIGNGAKSATINSQPVAFHTVLQNGDRVKINHSRFSQPDPIWLNYAVTGNARMAIRKSLKQIKRKQVIKMGDRLFRSALKTFGHKYSSLTAEMKEKLIADLNVDQLDDVFYEIGIGERIAAAVVGQIYPDAFASSDMSSAHSNSVPISGTEGLGVQFAKCCTPIPRDPIVGLFHLGRGIAIHTEDCPNVRASKIPPEQWAKLYWSRTPKGQFSVSIRVEAEDRKGTLAKISSVISKFEANISYCYINTVDSKIAIMESSIEVSNTRHLEKIMREIEKVPEVIKVNRIKLK